MEYQHSWQWVKTNWKAPLPAVLYVSGVSLSVGAKNSFSANKHDVWVERQPEGEQLARDTQVCLPRICITRRDDLTSAAIHTLQQRLLIKLAK